ncbi:hypothetical protein V8G54_004334 [Vigna mungo]|uniref:Uncharacterized protein n=1 Tax=Vigna mungo TaxID=3915 RepID=A0AAQ3PGK4_VIGMU
MSFGRGSKVSGSGVVSTPLVTKEDKNTFVVNKYFHYDGSSENVEKGNMFLNSGSPLTILPTQFYDRVVVEVKNQVAMTLVGDDPDLGIQLCYRTKNNLLKSNTGFYTGLANNDYIQCPSNPSSKCTIMEFIEAPRKNINLLSNPKPKYSCTTKPELQQESPILQSEPMSNNPQRVTNTLHRMPSLSQQTSQVTKPSIKRNSLHRMPSLQDQSRSTFFVQIMIKQSAQLTSPFESLSRKITTETKLSIKQVYSRFESPFYKRRLRLSSRKRSRGHRRRDGFSLQWVASVTRSGSVLAPYGIRDKPATFCVATVVPLSSNNRTNFLVVLHPPNYVAHSPFSLSKPDERVLVKDTQTLNRPGWSAWIVGLDDRSGGWSPWMIGLVIDLDGACVPYGLLGTIRPTIQFDQPLGRPSMATGHPISTSLCQPSPYILIRIVATLTIRSNLASTTQPYVKGIPTGLTEGRRPWILTKGIPVGLIKGRRPWIFTKGISTGLTEGWRPWIFTKGIRPFGLNYSAFRPQRYSIIRAQLLALPWPHKYLAKFSLKCSALTIRPYLGLSEIWPQVFSLNRSAIPWPQRLGLPWLDKRRNMKSGSNLSSRTEKQRKKQIYLRTLGFKG